MHTTTAADKTLVTLLLDRSGSMQSAKDDTIGAFNSYLSGLRASAADIRLTLVLFDTEGSAMALEKVHVARPIADVPNLTADEYVPRGSTPLIDAACTTIRAVSDSLVGHDARVVFTIQTDGMENASQENSWDDLKALVAEKEAAGWEFLFLGCGIDAYEQSDRMGLRQARSMSYRRTGATTRAAFEGLGEDVAAFAEGARADLSFSIERRVSAGDDYDARRRTRE